MTWKDTTPRSQQNPDKPASCWTLDNEKIEITVLNSHREDPGEWVMHCHKLGFDCKRIWILPTATPEEAQECALFLVRTELREMLESIT